MKKINFKTLFLLAFASITTVVNAEPAKALWVNFTYDSGVSWEYKRAAEFAAYYWEDRFSDNVKVNIHLDVASANKLPQGVLGGAIPAFDNNVNYLSFQNSLSSDRKSNNDDTAFNNLPNWNGYGTWSGYIEAQWKSNNQINLTRANSKALGLIDSHNSELDGTILLSDLSNVSYNWEDNRLDGVGNNEFDLTSVLIHEIGHIMGFVSAVDSVNASNIYNRENRYDYITPLNIFTRHGASSKTYNGINIAYGENSYFSLDGGHTNLGYFSTGEDGNLGTWAKGDGWQASHWKSNIDAMMNPYISNGQRRNLTNLDLTAFDVIGWDRDYQNQSDATLKSWADSWANQQGNVDKTSALDKMFNQRGWGGNSRSTTYRQNMEIADYLYQEGLFQKGSAGTLWSTFDPAAADRTSVPEPVSVIGLLGLGLLGICSRQKKHLP